jgi:hypothetical protein
LIKEKKILFFSFSILNYENKGWKKGEGCKHSNPLFWSLDFKNSFVATL